MVWAPSKTFLSDESALYKQTERKGRIIPRKLICLLADAEEENVYSEMKSASGSCYSCVHGGIVVFFVYRINDRYIGR